MTRPTLSFLLFVGILMPLITSAQEHSNDLLVRLKENNKTATRLYDLGAIDSALQVIDPLAEYTSSQLTEEIRLQLALNYRLAKQVFNRKGDYRGTVDVLKKAVELLTPLDREGPELVASVMDVGIAFWRLTQYDSAIAWTDRSVQIAISSQQDWRKKYLQRGYLMMGLAHWSDLSLEKAVLYNKLALNTIGEDIKANARDYFLLMNNLSGVFESQEEYDSAIIYNKKGLRALELISEGDEHQALVPYYKAEMTSNLGALYYLAKDFALAREHLLEAVVLKEAYYGKGHENLTRTFWNLGRIFRDMGSYEESQKYFNEGLNAGEGRATPDYDFLLRTYNDMADLFIKANDIIKAEMYLDSAKQASPKLVKASDTLYLGVGIFQTYEKELELINLQAHDEKAIQVDNLFEKAKEQLNFFYQNNTHYFILNEARPFFGQLWRTYSTLLQEFEDEKYAHYLWEISEINKARSLADKSSNAFALEHSVSQDDQLREQVLKDSVAWAMTGLGEPLQDSLYLALTNRYEQLIQSFESKYPDYHRLKYKQKLSTMWDARGKLGDREVVACFFDAIDTVYGLFISPDRIYQRQYEKNELQTLVGDLNSKVFQGQSEEIEVASKELTAFLLGSDFNWETLERAHIIPDGLMWDVNFSLINLGEKKNQILFNEISFTYQYSGTAWLNSLPKKGTGILAMSQGMKPEQITIANGIFRSEASIDLPGTGLELSQMEPLLEGDYYYNSEASESLFKRQTSGNGIIHLALHGVMNNYQPERSFLQFHQADSLNDSRLHVYEIYGLDLDANLVVLSACNSGSGRKVRGEGILSLGRAFKAVGANSLLLARWDVSDAVAPILMNYFYQELKKGLPKSLALSNAQRRFLEQDADDITSSPYYWSSFYILGDDAPVFERSGLSLPSKLLILLTLILAIVGFGKFRSYNN